MYCSIIKVGIFMLFQGVLNAMASPTPTVHPGAVANVTATPTASPLQISHFGPNQDLAVEFSLLVTGTISATKSFVVRVSPPTFAPSGVPTIQPSSRPTLSPSLSPTTSPTALPTISPTSTPTGSPTVSPEFTTNEPTTLQPTNLPTTNEPTTSGTRKPSKAPTVPPTNLRTTKSPTKAPTNVPTTKSPTLGPTKAPTKIPTKTPTNIPTISPTRRTLSPTLAPTFGDMTVIIASVSEQAPLSKTQVVNFQGQTVDIASNLAITGDTEFTTTVILENPKLDEFPLTRLIIFSWCLKLDSNQQNCEGQLLKFFMVKVTVILSSIIANPVSFVYDLEDGVMYTKATLTPDPIVKLFNVLNSDLSFTVSKSCRESPSRSDQPWLELGLIEGEIGAQSGAPKEIDFSINLTASSIPVNFSDPFLENPAARLEGCLEISGVLGSQVLDTTVLVDLSVSRICPSGAFSADRGRDGRQGCQRCPIGTYQNQAGQVSCRSCSEVSSFTTTLNSASISSNDCVALEGYFYNTRTGTIDICPLEAECKNPALTLETLPLKPGMWRTAARSNVTRLCPRVTRKYCIGGVNETATSLGERGLINQDVVFNATGAYCAKNHAGAFCVACIENSAKRTGPNGLCELCTSDSLVADQLAFVGGIFLIFFVLIICFFVVAFLMSLDEEKSISYFSGGCCTREKDSTDPLASLMRTKKMILDPQSLDFTNTAIRILLGHVQVVFIMGKTFENQLPEFLTSYYFSFFSFSPPNLITVGCVLPSANHYSKLLFATIAPLLCMAAMLLVYSILRCRLKPKLTSTHTNHAVPESGGHDNTNQATSRSGVQGNAIQATIESSNPGDTNQILSKSTGRCGRCQSLISDIFAWTKDRTQLDTRFRSLFLFFLFLIYPTTSSSILGTFTCDRTFDDGSSFLAVDYSVQCFTPTYNSFFIYSIFMVILYVVGIPFYFAFILFRFKVVAYFHSIIKFQNVDQLTGDEEQQQLMNRGEDEKGKEAGVGSSRFLWRPYKNEWYFWEVFELIRKLLQTSVLVLVSPGSPLQVVYLLVITVIMVLIIIIISPYSDSDSTNVALICQLSILYISFACLLASVDPLGNDFDFNAIQITVALAFGLVYAFVAYVMIRRATKPDFSVMKTLGGLDGFFEALAKGTSDTRKRIVILWKSMKEARNTNHVVLLGFQLFGVLILALPAIIFITIWECMQSLKRYHDQLLFQSEAFNSTNPQSINTSQFSSRAFDHVNDPEQAAELMNQAISDPAIHTTGSPNPPDEEQVDRSLASPASIIQPLIASSSLPQRAGYQGPVAFLSEKLREVKGQLFGAKEHVKAETQSTQQEEHQDLNQSMSQNIVDSAAGSPYGMLNPPSINVGAVKRGSPSFVSDKMKGIKLFFGSKDHASNDAEEVKVGKPQESNRLKIQHLLDPADQFPNDLQPNSIVHVAESSQLPSNVGEEEDLGSGVPSSDNNPGTSAPFTIPIDSTQQPSNGKASFAGILSGKIRNAKGRILVLKETSRRKRKQEEKGADQGFNEEEQELEDGENGEDEGVFGDPYRESLFDDNDDDTAMEKLHVKTQTSLPPVTLKPPAEVLQTPTDHLNVDYEEEEEDTHRDRDGVNRFGTQTEFKLGLPTHLKISRPLTPEMQEPAAMDSDYESETERTYQEEAIIRRVPSIRPQPPEGLNVDLFLNRGGGTTLNTSNVTVPEAQVQPPKNHLLPTRTVVNRFKSRLTDAKRSAHQALSSLRANQLEKQAPQNDRQGQEHSRQLDAEEDIHDQAEEEVSDDALSEMMDEYSDED